MSSSPLTSKSYYPWLAWACAASFFFFQFMLRVSPSVFAKDMMPDLNMDRCTFGGMAAFYYAGYTWMQIIVGLSLDRFGVRRPLTIAILLCFTGALIFSQSSTFYPLAFGRLLMGIGAAFGFLSCMKIATSWFPANKIGSVIGMSMIFGSSGAIFGGAPLAMLVEYTGWQDSVLILAFLSLLIAMCTWLIVRDHDQVAPTAADEHLPIIMTIKIVLSKPQTYVFAAYGLLKYVPLSAFADLWGVQFIKHVYNISDIEAAGAVSFTYVGFGLSGLLTALLADVLQSYKKPMILGCIVSICAIVALLYLPALPFYLLSVLFGIFGIFLGAQIFAFACVCELNPKNVSGTASGIHNMICMMSGMIFQPLVGYLLDINGSPDGVHSLIDYQYALTVVPICMAVALLITFKMKELYPKDNKVNV